MPNAKFVVFGRRSHLLMGYSDKARAAVHDFLQEVEASKIVRWRAEE
jgi:hypothetical protein